jgi:hypothetical protein
MGRGKKHTAEQIVNLPAIKQHLPHPVDCSSCKVAFPASSIPGSPVRETKLVKTRFSRTFGYSEPGIRTGGSLVQI